MEFRPGIDDVPLAVTVGTGYDIGARRTASAAIAPMKEKPAAAASAGRYPLVTAAG